MDRGKRKMRINMMKISNGLTNIAVTLGMIIGVLTMAYGWNNEVLAKQGAIGIGYTLAAMVLGLVLNNIAAKNWCDTVNQMNEASKNI